MRVSAAAAGVWEREEMVLGLDEAATWPRGQAPYPGWPEALLQQLGVAKRRFSHSLGCSLEGRIGKTSGVVSSCVFRLVDRIARTAKQRKEQLTHVPLCHAGRFTCVNSLYPHNNPILIPASDEETEAQRSKLP